MPQHEPISPEQIRRMRLAYDRELSPGDRATLKRCRDADDIVLEGAFWRIASAAPPEARSRLATVVACFPAATQLRRPEGFQVGRFLRNQLHPGVRTVSPAKAVRFRQLVQARDLDELGHRLRKLLVHAGAPVDWGVLGRDVFFWSDNVRRRWAQDFYSLLTEESHA
jgi:CRISPR type I-E-associated protein CasB/Cse2